MFFDDLNLNSILNSEGAAFLGPPDSPSSEEEEVLFYGPPTLSQHRAFLAINRAMTPELPPALPSTPPAAPQHPPPSDAAPAPAVQPSTAEGFDLLFALTAAPDGSKLGAAFYVCTMLAC